MKIGVISDIHGDVLALELAWSHLTGLGVDQIVCAGDLVGYGPFPDRVVAFLREREVESVRGNHDRWAIERGPAGADPFGGKTPDPETLEYLSQLPFHHLIADGKRIGVIVHGSPRSDMEFISRGTYPTARLRDDLETLGSDLLIVGHTHQPMWYRCERGLVVNPGSIVSLNSDAKSMPAVTSSRTFACVDMQTLCVSFHDVESGTEIAIQPWSDPTDDDS